MLRSRFVFNVIMMLSILSPTGRALASQAPEPHNPFRPIFSFMVRDLSLGAVQQVLEETLQTNGTYDRVSFGPYRSSSQYKYRVEARFACNDNCNMSLNSL